MSDKIELKGRCLCGAVTVEAKQASTHVGACHCGMCRRWGGGPLMAVDCGTEVVIGGRENVSVFNSSEWAERGFCNQCGSHLFYRLKESGQHMMPAGLFEDSSQMVLSHQVFIDNKPEFYSFSNETKDMTEAEIFAMYAPPNS